MRKGDMPYAAGVIIRCLPFTKQKIRKIRLESKWSILFLVVRAENFQEQRNIWKVSPVFPDGIFQTEIRVPLLQSHLWCQFQASAVVFRWMELIKFVQTVNAIPGWNLPVLNFAYHLPKPWTDRFAHPDVNGRQQSINKTAKPYFCAIFVGWSRP